jgi:hypothetical protein
MISFSKFISLKEALSLDDPLAQSTLKIKDKNNTTISFEFTLDNNNYKIIIYSTPKIISIQYEQREIILDRFKLMYISLKANQSHSLTNQSGMQANTVYNMLLNAIKQAHDHFGENNINGYTFSGVEPAQDLMYYRLMKRFAPKLITWSIDDGIYLKHEAVQKLKDQNPDLIEEINDHIHQETSQREMQIQQDKQNKAQQRLLRRQT